MKTTTVAVALTVILTLTTGTNGAFAQAPLRPDGSPNNAPEASKPINPPEKSRPINPPEQATPVNPPGAPIGTPPRAVNPVETTTTPVPNNPPDTRPATLPVVDPALPSSLTLQSAGTQWWAQAKDYTFADRARFLTLFQRFGLRIDTAISDLKTKRVSFRGEPAAWDAEMKRLDDARAFYDSTLKELADATAANWDARKERFGTAWERLSEAYTRALALAPSGTSS